jgi:hypothetical protein
MANQMQPATKGSGPAWIYALAFLAAFLTFGLAFCGSAVERAVKQVDEISECRADTDACNAPAAPELPDVSGLPPNPDGTPYGTCRARYPLAATGGLPPDADFDANLVAPPHCIYVQTPSGAVVAAYAYNRTDDEIMNGSTSGGGGIFNWGSFFRVFLFLFGVSAAFIFWRRWRRMAHLRKQQNTIDTQPVGDDGRPKLPMPVPVPGLPDDDDDPDDDEDEDYR